MPDKHLNIPEGESLDLFEYLASLPDVDAELPPLQEQESEAPEETGEKETAAEEPPTEELGKKTQEETDMEALVNLLRERSRAGALTSFLALQKENEAIGQFFEKLKTEEKYKEEYKDIVYIQGSKDKYYYSNIPMTDQFANIAALVEEKDLPRTVAHVVRTRSEYPASTKINHFMGYPYHYSAEEIKQVRETFKTNPEYEDIGEFMLRNKAEYFFSTKYLTPQLAFALEEDAQSEESGYWAL